MVSLIGLGLVLALGLAAYVRFAPSDPDVWHVDPVTVRSSDRPNHWLAGPEDVLGARALTPVYGVPPERLAAAADAHAMAEGAVRIAGSPAALWTTYLFRTPLMGFPDYASVRVIPAEGGGAELAIFSRARFGRGDMGVNRARVEKWLEALAPMQQEPGNATPGP